MQGHNLALAAAKKQNLVWKNFMYNLKQGTLKFLLNAGILHVFAYTHVCMRIHVLIFFLLLVFFSVYECSKHLTS